jgi:trehalose-phosphatase
VVSDFDGTLASLVMDPWGAQMLPTARRALRRLAGCRDVAVALISGRTAADLCQRARVGGALYLGNHGLEVGWLRRRGRPTGLQPASRAGLAGFAELADQLADQVVALVPEPWLIVERKGPAVTFHYRQAPDVPRAGRRVQAAVDRIDHGRRFERLPGRRMLELRPPGAPSKQGTLEEVMAALRPGVAIMLGDDISDAQAFAALRRAAAGSRGRSAALSLAVRARVEPLPQVEALADAVLGSPADAAAFLADLAAAVAARGAERAVLEGFDWADSLGGWVSGGPTRPPARSG